MTGEIVNLRLARKRKARAQAEADAAANRAAYGRAKTEKKAAAAHEALEARRLDGHRLDSGET